jgi:hypothetical protein
MLGHRDPRQRDKDYLGWIATLPCLACMCLHGKYKLGVHVAHVRFADDAAGWRSVGMQEKPSDVRTVPLCPPHHVGDSRKTSLTQHNMNEREFYEALGVNAPDVCLALRDAYENGTSGSTVIARFGALATRKRESS